MPTHPVLLKFLFLNNSGISFGDELVGLLGGEDYRRCVNTVSDDNLKWLIEYLDDVCRVALPTLLLLNLCRHSNISTPATPRIGNV